MAQLFETLCMMLAFKESHSLAVHYCRLVWDVRSLSNEHLSCQSSNTKYLPTIMGMQPSYLHTYK